MKRVTILVTHLLGTGHLSRSLTLARALRRSGLSPQLVSGGIPVGHLKLDGVDFVQLPPLRSDGASFTRLLDIEGNAVTPELVQERIRLIEQTLLDSSPDVLVTELFPFGRRILRDEFLAAIRTAELLPRKPLVLSSVRDILAPPSNTKKAKQTEAWLRDHFDAVLVHSDPSVVPLEASWPVTPQVARLLRYTGFIAPPAPDQDLDGTDGAGEIIVTAGGGPVGRRLFEVAIDAARLSSRPWRLIVGGGDAEAFCAKLNEMARDARVVAEPLRPDYRSMLMHCAAAVGQCGYNTAMDWLQAGVPGVFVPFAEAGEIEQTLRASSLSQRYGYGLIAEQELSGEKLAEAAETAVSRGRFKAEGLQFDGAARTAAIINELLAARG